MSRLAGWRRAAAGLLALSALATGAAAIHAAATSPAFALIEDSIPDEMSPEALRLHIEALLAAEVNADWLDARTRAALDAAPPDWARLDAVDALAAERGLSLSPDTAARLDAAKAGRPTWLGGCGRSILWGDLPDQPGALACYFTVAVTTPLIDIADLAREGWKGVRGETVDEVTVAIAALGAGGFLLPGGSVAKAAAAVLRAARKLGYLSRGLIRELAEAGRALFRFDPGRGWNDWIDPVAWSRLAAAAGDLGRLADTGDPVAAIRALRHADSLDGLRRVGKVAEAVGPNAATRLEAVGVARIFARVTRVSRSALEIGGLIGAALAQIGLAALALGQSALLRRLLRPLAGA